MARDETFLMLSLFVLVGAKSAPEAGKTVTADSACNEADGTRDRVARAPLA